MNKQEAQARADRIGAFLSEMALLEREGIVALDVAQRRAVADYYDRLLGTLKGDFDVDCGDSQRRMSLGMRIASVVGALALSAAVFLFFYRIWGLLATPWQVAVIVAAPLVGVGVTEIAARVDTTRHFVFIAALIACAGIVLNIVMLGDIFAMTDSPNALLVWALFALAIGYAYGLRLPVAAGLALAMAFVAGSNLAWRGIDWKSFATL